MVPRKPTLSCLRVPPCVWFRNPEGAWTAVTEYTGKDAGRLWLEGHGWPTARQSYLTLFVKEGIPPPQTRQNVVEWLKAVPMVTFPVGSTGTIDPVIGGYLNEAIAGKRSVRDAAEAIARDVTNLLQRG